LQRYRVEHPQDVRLMSMSAYLVDYPFANRLYPGALDVLDRFRSWGPTVILSDGDVVFQPSKVQRSGIWEAVDGHVLIYIHKEEMLEDVERRYPAQHYVLVDDKPRILAAVKDAWGERVTTIFPRQGQYARDAKAYRPADLTIERIGDLLTHDLPDLGPDPRRGRLGVARGLAAARPRHRQHLGRRQGSVRSRGTTEPPHQDPRHEGRAAGHRGGDLRRHTNQRDAPVLVRAVPGR